MDLSIIIVSYNSSALLERCLKSIESFVGGLEYEVCVVDNASSDDSVERARAWKGNLRLVRQNLNFGFAKALNAGLRETSGRYCLWLNPDSELKSGKLEDLIAAFTADPALAVIGPRIENP